jgi:hypothetical protein
MINKPLFKGSGLTARDLIVIILILADVYLVSTGHQALDAKLTQVEAQTVRSCEAVTR